MRLAIELLLAFLGVGNNAVYQRKNRKVAAHTHALTREPVGAFLANDDGTGLSNFSGKEFNAESFRDGISAVLGGATGFLMCHGRGGKGG